MRHRLLQILVGLGLLLPVVGPRAQSLTVFAAASLTEAMRAVDQAWTAQGHPRLLFSFAASSTLARQLDQGAPANIFASADEEWMDWAVKHHLIVETSIRNVLTNSSCSSYRRIMPNKSTSSRAGLWPRVSVGTVRAAGGRGSRSRAGRALCAAGFDEARALGCSQKSVGTG
jgi:molybdate transport system substrate-binding protein